MKDIISEILFIVGSFILAETVIRQYLVITEGVTTWWVLPLLAIMLIIEAINLKEGNKVKFSDISMIVMFLLLMGFVGLFNKKVMSGNVYIWSTLGVIVLQFIIYAVQLSWERIVR